MTRHATGIQWTHVPGYIGATWNPTTGCTRVSPGCDHCYAFALHDQRFAANRQAHRESPLRDIPMPEARRLGLKLPLPAQYDVPFSTVQLLDEYRLTAPLRARKPHAYFVDSMSDLFHEDVPDEVLDRVFAVMALAPQHIFMVLTKRPERMRAYVSSRAVRIEHGLAFQVWWAMGEFTPPTGKRSEDMVWPLPNLWLGVSVEDQERADERISHLLATPAAVRFLSCEPLLGPVDLRHHLFGGEISWVIVGGESGPQARPFSPGWARVIRDDCRDVAACFVKQMGSHVVERNDQGFDGDDPSEWPEGTRTEDVHRGWRYQGDPVRVRLRHNHGGNPDEWPEDLRVREFPASVGVPA